MAERLMRGTVNTFFRGSSPLDAYLIILPIPLIIFPKQGLTLWVPLYFMALAFFCRAYV